MSVIRHRETIQEETDDTLLYRARRHFLLGKERLYQGKISLGILTLYDSLNSAMQWYVSSPERRKFLPVIESTNLNDDFIIHDLLLRAGIISDALVYKELDSLVETALHKDMSSFEYSGLCKSMSRVLAELGIMKSAEGTMDSL